MKLLYCGQTVRLHRGSILCHLKKKKIAWLKQEQIPVKSWHDTRKEKRKFFSNEKKKLLEKQRAKEEAKRKQRQQRLNLVSSITELGGPWKSEKEIKEGLMKIASEKEKQKALVNSESCPPGCSTNQGTFSAR